MTEETTYRAVLVPEGIPPEQTTDMFEFTFTTESHGNLEQEATKHIHKTKVMDPVSFRKYWEIYEIAPKLTLNNGPVNTVKEGLRTFNPGNVSTNGGNLHAHEFHTYNTKMEEWRTHSLLLTNQRKDEIENLWTTLARTHKFIALNGEKYLHEAMVHVFADRHPLITASFAHQPVGHAMMVQDVLKDRDNLVPYIRKIIEKY